MSPTSYQAALPRVIPSLLSATLIIIPYSNSFVKRVRKVFLQRKQRAKTRLLTFFPENQQPRQFTPLREGRHAVGAFAGRRAHFNSRPSARGDELLPRTHVKAVIFQFTPLREGRPARAVALSTTIRFQFTPLREGRLVHQVQPPRQPEFQFTPLREGRHALAAWLGG